MNKSDQIKLYSINDINDNFFPEIIALHSETFPTGLLSLLGYNFLCNYYGALIESPISKIIVAIENDRVVGFISFTKNNANEHISVVLKQSKSRILIKLFLFQLNIISLFRSFIKKKKSKCVHAFPELMSIAVLPEYRRYGIGKLLLSEMKNSLTEMGCNEFCVFTDNKEGISFYKKHSFNTIFEFTFFGITSACFRKEIIPNNEK